MKKGMWLLIAAGLAFALTGVQREKLSPEQMRLLGERMYLLTSLEFWGVYNGRYPETCPEYTTSPLYFRHPRNPFTGKPMLCKENPSSGDYFFVKEKPGLLHLTLPGISDSSQTTTLKNDTFKPPTTEENREDRYSLALANNLGAAFQGYVLLTGKFPETPEELAKQWGDPLELNPVSPVDGKPIKELFTWGTLKDFKVKSPVPKYVANWKELVLYRYIGKGDRLVAIYPLGTAKALRQTIQATIQKGS